MEETTRVFTLKPTQVKSFINSIKDDYRLLGGEGDPMRIIENSDGIKVGKIEQMALSYQLSVFDGKGEEKKILRKNPFLQTREIILDQNTKHHQYRED